MKLICDEAFAGLTVKKVLFDRLGFSRSAVTQLKNRPDGILVNGEHKTVRHVLALGDTLSLATEDAAPSPRIRPSEGPIDILYEDDALIALNKPPHMAVHPSKKLQDDTLAGRLLHHRYPMVFRAAGRLDKDTSGVVISAKSKVISARFFDLMMAHGIRKEYLLLTVSDKEAPLEGEIALGIRRSEESYVRRECFVTDGTEPASQRALTRFRLIASRAPYHLFLAAPITGRTHQLRAHFSAIGFPIVGDTLYAEASDLIDRQALHAYRLSFPHPETALPLSITAPLPSDLKQAIEQTLGKIPLPEASPPSFFVDKA